MTSPYPPPNQNMMDLTSYPIIWDIRWPNICALNPLIFRKQKMYTLTPWSSSHGQLLIANTKHECYCVKWWVPNKYAWTTISMITCTLHVTSSKIPDILICHITCIRISHMPHHMCRDFVHSSFISGHVSF